MWMALMARMALILLVTTISKRLAKVELAEARASTLQPPECFREHPPAPAPAPAPLPPQLRASAITNAKHEISRAARQRRSKHIHTHIHRQTHTETRGHAHARAHAHNLNFFRRELEGLFCSADELGVVRAYVLSS